MASTFSPVFALTRSASCSRDADHVLDLLDRLAGIRRRQVDLVQHRDHFHALLDRGVAVGHGLRLDALRGVHHQHGALAGGERAAHLVREVHVARRIDQVELIRFSALRLVFKRGRLRLDRDAALALELHRVEHLLRHLALGQPAAHLDEAVGERRLAMVDVRDDGKIADAILIRQGGLVPCKRSAILAQLGDHFRGKAMLEDGVVQRRGRERHGHSARASGDRRPHRSRRNRHRSARSPAAISSQRWQPCRLYNLAFVSQPRDGDESSAFAAA